MPLKKTPKGASKKQRKKILSENIRRAVEAGKPQKQAVAIAYSVARRGKKRRKNKSAKK